MMHETGQVSRQTISSTVAKLAHTILATVYRTRFASHADNLWRFLKEAQFLKETQFLDENRQFNSPSPSLPPDYTLILTAIERIYATEGQIRVQTLAVDAGLSPRQFERYFKQRVRLTPKQLIRIIRFEVVRNRLLQIPPHPNALAHEFSYTDESHFIHDFKAIAGMTPCTFTKNVIQRGMSGFYRTPDPRLPYHSLISNLMNGTSTPHDRPSNPNPDLARDSSYCTGNP
ncbi:MAG TPA: helix-turn-helix domain-containing protein [Phototrophicaceae bacterium]|jgi:AraC-like DNA-binding protein|nr:helix-turn-helix domain-containing protein [Phototrophicaceae bacterium]